MNTYNDFQKDIIDLATELKAEYDLADALDHVHEIVDGLESVIYYDKAWDFVNMMRLANSDLYDEAQDMLSAVTDRATDLNTLMSTMAFCIYTIALNDYLYKAGE